MLNLSKVTESLLNSSPGWQYKHVFGSGGCRDGRLPNSCLRVEDPSNILKPLHITARRFN